MNNYFLTSLLLLSFGTTLSLTLGDTLNATLNKNGITNCTRQGFSCKSCYDLFICYRAPDGSLFGQIANCIYGTTCLNGACTYSENPDCTTSTAPYPTTHYPTTLNSTAASPTTPGPTTVAPPVCKVSGVFCYDCQTSIYCDEKNNSRIAQQCVAPQTCNMGKCSSTPAMECTPQGQLPFVCTTGSNFPDPVDCHKYHVCVAKSGKPTEIEYTFQRSCPPEYSYNPRTTYCDIKLPSTICPKYIVPLCNYAGQSAALVQNPSIYYICLQYSVQTLKMGISYYGDANPHVLYPFLYLCDNGKRYNGNYKCVV